MVYKNLSYTCIYNILHTICFMYENRYNLYHTRQKLSWRKQTEADGKKTKNYSIEKYRPDSKWFTHTHKEVSLTVTTTASPQPSHLIPFETSEKKCQKFDRNFITATFVAPLCARVRVKALDFEVIWLAAGSSPTVFFFFLLQISLFLLQKSANYVWCA